MENTNKEFYQGVILKLKKKYVNPNLQCVHACLNIVKTPLPSATSHAFFSWE